MSAKWSYKKNTREVSVCFSLRSEAISKNDFANEFFPDYRYFISGYDISEIIKSQVHSGRLQSVYYWRESNGTEIDCIIEREEGGITALEIKAGQTFTKEYMRNLLHFPGKINEGDIQKCVVYAGSESVTINEVRIISWNDFVQLSFVYN